MPPSKGPYLNLEHAAEYCGYRPRTFSDKVKEYDIPRKGDQENRFSVMDLDRWMDDPLCFKEEKKYLPMRKPGGFTPIRI